MLRLVTVLAVVLASPLMASAQSIQGVWRRVQLETEGGPNPGIRQSEPALLIYTENYFMWTMVQGEGPRPMLPPSGEATDTQIADAARRYTGISGTYEIDGSTITYTREVAWVPNNMVAPNNVQVREIVTLTDDTLETTGGRNQQTGARTVSRYVRVE